jgi:hypothetical protein
VLTDDDGYLKFDTLHELAQRSIKHNRYIRDRQISYYHILIWSNNNLLAHSFLLRRNLSILTKTNCQFHRSIVIG